MSVRTKATAFAKLVRGDSEKRWVLAEKLATAAHPEAILGEHAKSWRHDARFRAAVARTPATARQLDRLFALDQLARRAATLPGDFAECGVFAGASAWFLASRGAPAGKQVLLFDSWEGLSAPTEIDGGHWSEHDLATPIDIARRTLADFENVRFYRGWIPQRFDEVADCRFALVHIDVDLFVPTRASIEFFYPRLVDGGVVICDDYGFDTCPGARNAIDTYCEEVGEVAVELPTGQGLVVRRPS